MKKFIPFIAFVILFTACQGEFVRLGNPTTNLPKPGSNYGGDVPSAPETPQSPQDNTIISNEFWKSNPTWTGSSYADSNTTIYLVTVDIVSKKAAVLTTSFIEEIKVSLNIDNNGSFSSGEFLNGLQLISTGQNDSFGLAVVTPISGEVIKLSSIETPDNTKSLVDTEQMCLKSESSCFDLDNTLLTKQYFMAGYIQLSDSNTKDMCTMRIYDECTPEGKLKEVVCPETNNGHKYKIIDCKCLEGRCIENPIAPKPSNDTLKASKDAININQHLLDGNVYIPK